MEALEAQAPQTHTDAEAEAEATANAANTRRLRRSDVKAGTILALLSLGMFWNASSFPVQDSYAGVETQWYVSPALMPLLVSGALFILSLVLIVNALSYAGKTGGIARLLREKAASTGDFKLRLLTVTLFFAGFIYGMIPHADFIVATLYFLSFFILTFYIDRPGLLKFNLVFFAVSSLLIAVLGETKVLEPYLFYPVDIVTAALLIIGAAINLKANWPERAQRSSAIRALYISFIVTFLIGGSFKYGLLVPLPTEGAVVRTLDKIHSAFRTKPGN